jgi:hypothetical protein
MLALIIWGTRSSEKVVGEGQFSCPQCRNHVPFTHKKLQRYFTLYFIPLFPIGTIAEFVECVYCRGNFQMQVLQMQGPPPGAPPQGGQGWGGPGGGGQSGGGQGWGG